MLPFPDNVARLPNQSAEQRVRTIGPGLKFRVKLHSHHKRVVRDFRRFNQFPIR